ncbi:MAG: FAD:protein FMN transferase [Chloroflexota bacterium]
MTVVAFRFRAMNTDIALLSPTDGPEFEHASSIVRGIFAEVECCLSRFQPDSELSHLNRAAGQPFEASPLLFEAVWLAVRAASETNGVFDPTVLSALEYAGYDRSFERIHAPAGRTGLDLLPDYRAIECDPTTRTIRLAAGQRVDLGGIGKGFAVDRAYAASPFLEDRCIAAGGDIVVHGNAENEGPWTIALEDTGDLEPRSIAVRDAAVATSTTLKRRWQRHGQTYHHLIDPRTGRPSQSPLRTVMVVAATCVHADVAAKTALLLGDSGMDFLEQHGMHGFGVRLDGSTVCTSQWPRDGG